jgi:signal peptidase II
VRVNARCGAVLAGTALLGITLDQATKALVVATREGKAPIRVVGQVLTIYVTRNSGAAFSFAPAATVLFTGVAVAAAVLIAIKAPRLCSVGWAIALGLVLAGAIGNLCDRLVRAPGIDRGAVVDFIDLQHFADFNIADSCLTCGVVFIVLLSLRGIPMTGRGGSVVGKGSWHNGRWSRARASASNASDQSYGVDKPDVIEDFLRERVLDGALRIEQASARAARVRTIRPVTASAPTTEPSSRSADTGGYPRKTGRWRSPGHRYLAGLSPVPAASRCTG